MIKTHEELIKFHGKKVRCKIKGTEIDDAKILVEHVNGYDKVYICQNLKEGLETKDKLGYRYSWCVSESDNYKYEEDNQYCIDIELVEEKHFEEKHKDIQCLLVPCVIVDGAIKAQNEWKAFEDVHKKLREMAMNMKSNELKKFVKKLGKTK